MYIDSELDNPFICKINQSAILSMATLDLYTGEKMFPNQENF